MTLGGTLTLGGELTVHRLAFGAMRLTGPGIIGPPTDKAEAIRVLRRAVERGVDFIDTADSYGPHFNEELIAEALYPYPRGLVIATKAGFERPGPHQWTMNGHPAKIRAGCEGSLKRLRVDRIDLFQLHRIDPAFSEDDQFGVVDDLRREGKVRLIGLSEVQVPAIVRARERLGVVSVQNRYSVADRGSEPVVDYCDAGGLAFLPWYPLGAGGLVANGVLAQVAARNGATAVQVAIAWLLARSPHMLVIPGTSRVDHLEENLAAAALPLGPRDLEDLAALDSPAGR